MVEVDECVWPELLSQFFPGHHFARMLQQNGQKLKRLAAQFELHASPAQFSGTKIKLEVSEA
jgi:hypothetical protein